GGEGAGSGGPRRGEEARRRGGGGVAGTSSPGVRRDGGRRHPRPLLPRQRRGMDPGARSRRGHPLGGQLLLVARPEGGTPRTRGEGDVSPPADPSARARVGAHGAARTTGE